MKFDDPKPETEKRVQQIIYLRPSLRTAIDLERAVNRETRSAWIERAIEALLKRKGKS